MIGRYDSISLNSIVYFKYPKYFRLDGLNQTPHDGYLRIQNTAPSSTNDSVMAQRDKLEIQHVIGPDSSNRHGIASLGASI